MSFLDRLKNESTKRGGRPGRIDVRADDLAEIIHHFERMDRAARENSPAVVEALINRIVIREARRVEILDWLQHKIGTSWECVSCGCHTYHSASNECAECGAVFPVIHKLAFKLHAPATDNEKLITAARAIWEEQSLSIREERRNPPPSNDH